MTVSQRTVVCKLESFSLALSIGRNTFQCQRVNSFSWTIGLLDSMSLAGPKLLPLLQLAKDICSG